MIHIPKICKTYGKLLCEVNERMIQLLQLCHK